MGQQTEQFSYRGWMGYEIAQVEFEANVFGALQSTRVPKPVLDSWLVHWL